MDQHFFINLKNRPERKMETVTELRKLGIKKPNRFEAITHEIPLVGCARSHIGCLEEAKKRGWDYVIIFEDDIKIENKKKINEKIKKYINYNYDVLFLGCWNYEKPIQVEEDLARVVRACCLHAYIVKSHYYDTFIENLKEGVRLKLIDNLSENNNDEYMQRLQKKDKWFCITPIHITQKDGWSDNFGEFRNYSRVIQHIPPL
jgi:hypothetical protein